MTDRVPPLGDRDGEALLGDLARFVRRYVVVTDVQADVLALWIVHTWAIESTDSTPYLSVTSAEKRSGKTRLLEVLRLLTRAPLAAANVSEAALFRSLAEQPRTLLHDEVDAIFGPRARDREDLRALLNAGYRRGTPALRCVGEGSKQRVQEFEVFGAKALAGIGDLPDTLADRSLPIRLKRKAPGEDAERLRENRPPAEAAKLAERARMWADEHADALADAEPLLPDTLDDRAQDAAEPLVAIADMAGGSWPDRARRSLVELRRGDESTADESLTVRLLADCRSAFDSDDSERLSTKELLRRLATDEEGPWADWHGKALGDRALAGLLRPHGIRSRTIRFDTGETPKGYLREQFDDAWCRYLPGVGFPATTATTLETGGLEMADVADVAANRPDGEADTGEADDELERIRRKFPTLFSDEDAA